jgi:hypothetical protein
MDWDFKGQGIYIIAVVITVAITFFLMLGLINSMVGKFLRLQKFRDWIHIKLEKNSVWYFVIYFFYSTVSFLIIFHADIDDYVLKGIITGIMFGFAAAISYGSVAPKKKRKGVEK